MIFGLTLLDILLVLLFVSYAISGYRQGLVVSVLSLAGFPREARSRCGWCRSHPHWTSLETTPLMRTVVLIAGVFVLASIGQAVAVRISVAGSAAGCGQAGADLRRRPRSGVVVASAAVLVWFIAGALRGGAPPPVARPSASPACFA